MHPSSYGPTPPQIMTGHDEPRFVSERSRLIDGQVRPTDQPEMAIRQHIRPQGNGTYTAARKQKACPSNPSTSGLVPLTGLPLNSTAVAALPSPVGDESGHGAD